MLISSLVAGPVVTLIKALAYSSKSLGLREVRSKPVLLKLVGLLRTLIALLVLRA